MQHALAPNHAPTVGGGPGMADSHSTRRRYTPQVYKRRLAYEQRMEAFLGMHPTKAGKLLMRQLLLDLARRCGLGNCYRCGAPIADTRFALDHKQHWLWIDPARYWDLANVALSHPTCDRKAQRRMLERIGPNGTMRCTLCRECKPPDQFPAFIGGQVYPDGVRRHSRCHACRYAEKKARAARVQ